MRKNGEYIKRRGEYEEVFTEKSNEFDELKASLDLEIERANEYCERINVKKSSSNLEDDLKRKLTLLKEMEKRYYLLDCL